MLTLTLTLVLLYRAPYPNPNPRYLTLAVLRNGGYETPGYEIAIGVRNVWHPSDLLAHLDVSVKYWSTCGVVV